MCSQSNLPRLCSKSATDFAEPGEIMIRDSLAFAAKNEFDAQLAPRAMLLQ